MLKESALLQGHVFIDGSGVAHKASCGLAVLYRLLVPETAQPGHPDFSFPEWEKTGAGALDFYESHPALLRAATYVNVDRKTGTIENGET